MDLDEHPYHGKTLLIKRYLYINPLHYLSKISLFVLFHTPARFSSQIGIFTISIKIGTKTQIGYTNSIYNVTTDKPSRPFVKVASDDQWIPLANGQNCGALMLSLVLAGKQVAGHLTCRDADAIFSVTETWFAIFTTWTNSFFVLTWPYGIGVYDVQFLIPISFFHSNCLSLTDLISLLRFLNKHTKC